MARVTARASCNVRCSYSAKQAVKYGREKRCVLSMFLKGGEQDHAVKRKPIILCCGFWLIVLFV